MNNTGYFVMKSKYLSSLLTLLIVIGMAFVACDTPAGPEGPQGPEGPVGPAGEDGSMIYSGKGVPGSEVGTNGDYYLNQNTGELYGPKDSGDWGEPIIVLMGKDGQDGEDGSQIFSGSGAPDASLGIVGDYYLDKDNYHLYGPKTSSGWGSPLNLKGADGNANVTRYLFPGHDFSSVPHTFLEIQDVESSEEMKQSSWHVYLRDGSTYYHIPGVVNPDYLFSVSHYYLSNGTMSFTIDMRQGAGRYFDQIEVVRVEVSNTVDYRKQNGTVIPDDLDFSDYNEVAGYYGFWQ